MTKKSAGIGALLATAGYLAGCSGGAGGNSRESTITESSALAAPVDTTGWLHLPGGALSDPRCVHEVPNGSTIRKNGDVVLNSKVIANYGRCPNAPILKRPEPGSLPASSQPPGPGGWVEGVHTELTGGQQFGTFETEFTVPAPPATKADGQLIYLFPGLLAAGSTALLQPVLQWGITSAGGTSIGSFQSWTYAAWWGPDSSNQFHHSAGITVPTGDTLWAGMAIYLPGNPEVWLVEGYDTNNTGLGTPLIFLESTNLSWTRGWAAVLEAYGTNQTNCGDWPNGSSGYNFWATPSMWDTNGNPISPSWSTCAEPVVCLSPSYVGLNCNFGAGPIGTGWALTF